MATSSGTGSKTPPFRTVQRSLVADLTSDFRRTKGVCQCTRNPLNSGQTVTGEIGPRQFGLWGPDRREQCWLEAGTVTVEITECVDESGYLLKIH